MTRQLFSATPCRTNGSSAAAPALAALLSFVMLPAFVPTAAAQGTTTVLVQEGDAAPGGPGNFVSFSSSIALNDASQVAFFATLGGSGVTSTNDFGLYRFGDTDTVQIVRESAAAAAGPGNVTGFSGFALNDAGQVAFFASLAGIGVDTTNNQGLYRFGDAGTVQIARIGDAAPTGPGNFTSFTGSPALNDAGQAAFLAFLGGSGFDPTDDRGLYRFGDAGTVQIVRTGDAAPAGPGITFGFLNSPALNDSGQMAFRASLAEVDSGTNPRLYRLADAGILQIASAGDVAPDGPGNFMSFSNPTLNDAGQVAFSANLGGAGVDTTNDTGLYRFGDAGTVQIAREGDAVPTEPDTFFTGFTANSPALNNAGQAVFVADLGGTGVDVTNDTGLYRFGDAGTVQIARKGDAAPDGPGNFTDFPTGLALNDAGQAVFRAALGGTDVNSTNDTGLYFYDDILGLLTVAREGDDFLGSTITGLFFNSNREEETNSLNNLGQVAYRFTLADGNSGISLFTLSADQLLAGDYNDSGSVEQGDLDLVLNNWGGPRLSGVGGFAANADGFATGIVDQEELDRVLNNWGSSNAPSFEGSAVPEPATLALLSLGGLAMLRRRSA